MNDPTLAAHLESWIEQCHGVLRLKPTYVRRFYQFIDMQAAQDPEILERYRLVPTPAEGGSRDGEEHWIYPPTISRKFSGKRLRVPPGGTYESQESAPYALLVWRGAARVEGQTLREGDEAFVSHARATEPHRFTAAGNEGLEAFKFFPAE